MRKRSLLAFLLLAALCLTCVAATSSNERVAVFLAPKWAMGSEFTDLLDEFDELGIGVDVVSEKIGPYQFWEDSTEGFLCGALQDFYEWTIAHTYEDFELDGYDAIIVGPGFAHTVWIGETGPMAKEIVRLALEGGIPVGGVSYGAAVLVSWGFLEGRSAAMPPYYQGVVTQGTNKAMFFSEFPNVTFENASIWIDQMTGFTPIITARYGAVRKFAREIVDLI